MVRLEDRIEQNKTYPKKFQFHDGAIRRYGQNLVSQAENQFQFHDGAIRSWIKIEDKSILFAVSIPRWCD